MITEVADRREMGCFACNGVSDFYMVKNEVWLEAWPSYPQDKIKAMGKYEKGDRLRHLVLCLACLEAALGRPLTPGDFNFKLPINRTIELGMNMAKPKGDLPMIALESCVDCPHSQIVRDPDPYDSFNADDEALLCKKMPSPKGDDAHAGGRFEFKSVTSMARPYQTRKETSPPPNWCPLRGDK